MTIRIQPLGEVTARVQFILPDNVHSGPVSVVGDFNNWVPGKHKLIRRNNGTRSVTVVLPVGRPVSFRYLGSGGHWFDDEDARRSAEGSLLTL